MSYRNAVLERRIAAPVETVWNLLTSSQTGAGPDGPSAEQGPDPGTFGVGSSRWQTRWVNGRPVTTELLVTRCVPGAGYVVEPATSGAAAWSVEYALLSRVGEGAAEEPADGTLLRATVRTAEPGRLARLLARVRTPTLAAAVRQAVHDELAAVDAACPGREPAE